MISSLGVLFRVYRLLRCVVIEGNSLRVRICLVCTDTLICLMAHEIDIGDSCRLMCIYVPSRLIHGESRIEILYPLILHSLAFIFPDLTTSQPAYAIVTCPPLYFVKESDLKLTFRVVLFLSGKQPP